MRLTLPRRRIWRVAIYLISLDLVLTAADLLLVQTRRVIHPGYDTTRIITPTLPDGRVDYLKALDDGRSAGITPLNNAAPLLFQALGRKAIAWNQPPDGVTDRLGIPPVPEQGDYLVSFDDYRKLHSLTLSPGSLRSEVPTTLPSAIDAPTRQWIDAIAHPLDLLVEASNRPRFFIPFDGGKRPEMLIEVLICHVQPLEVSASALLTRAIIRLQSGDSDGACRDVLAVHRLARLLCQGDTLIERMTAERSMDVPACRIDRLLAAGGKLSADQLNSLNAQLRALGDLPPIANYVDNERVLALDATQAIAAVPQRFVDMLVDITNRPSGVPRFLFHFAPIPWESNMRAMNHLYDGALDALRQEPYSRRLAALQLWQQHLDSMKNRSSVSAAWSPDGYVSMLMFSVPDVERKQDIGIMERRLTEISLALAAYKADHAQYPAALATLVPAYLPAIPTDLFSENPPIYHPSFVGYALYSVGPDMIDDGGSADDISADVP